MNQATWKDIADIFESADYGIVETGNGGQAWENRINGCRVLITDLSGTSLPAEDDIFLVGFYLSDDAEPLYLEEYASAGDAIRAANIMAVMATVDVLRAQQ